MSNNLSLEVADGHLIESPFFSKISLRKKKSDFFGTAVNSYLQYGGLLDFLRYLVECSNVSYTDFLLTVPPVIDFCANKIIIKT